MRRILKKIAANEHDQLGDITTLADPSVVGSLVENRRNIIDLKNLMNGFFKTFF